MARVFGPFAERCVWSAAIAQLVEHVIRNDGVTGSSPVCGTTKALKMLFNPCTRPIWCFIIGFLCAFGFSFVYLYNLYLAAGTGLAFLMRPPRSEGYVKELSFLIFGGAACLLMHEAAKLYGELRASIFSDC